MPYCGDKVYILTKDNEIKAGIFSTAFVGLADEGLTKVDIRVGISYPKADGTFNYEEMPLEEFGIRAYANYEAACQAKQLYAEDPKAKAELEQLRDLNTQLGNLSGALGEFFNLVNQVDLNTMLDQLNEELKNLPQEPNYDDGDDDFDYDKGDEE